MGRMLDTLRQGTATPPAPEVAADWAADDDGAPYIEVGGPGKQVELSPGLIIPHPPQPPVQPPHAQIPAPKAARVVNLTPAAPMAVAFEPWPAAGPLGVAPEVIVYHQPTHPVSQEYAALLGRLLGSPEAANPALLLAGLRPHVGTSTVLLNLAAAAAAGGRTVAAVDAHPTRPALAARLGHPRSAGVQDVLGGRLALEQAVLDTAVPNLKVLPGAGPLTPEAAAWLFAWLRERFDLVLVDGPSHDAPADLAALAPRCDGVYLVLPDDAAPRVPRGPAQALARLGGRLRGLIHTHFAA